jgi:hypothetical protein
MSQGVIEVCPKMIYHAETADLGYIRNGLSRGPAYHQTLRNLHEDWSRIHQDVDRIRIC